MTGSVIRAGMATACAILLSLVVSVAPAAAQVDCRYDVTGEWVGKASGNRVMIEMRPGGFVSWVSGTAPPGPGENDSLFRDAGPGSWSFAPSADGQTTAALQGDALRIATADGWTDDFERVTPAPACNQAAAPPAKLKSLPRTAAVEPAPAPVPAAGDGRWSAIRQEESPPPERAPAAKPATAPAQRQPARQFPRAVTVAQLGTGCVTASLRDTKLTAVGAASGEGDWVLSNNCPMAQIVVVDVSPALGYTSWPATPNTGMWASTANADVPPGLAFTPLIALSESPQYVIPAFEEYVHHDAAIRLAAPADPPIEVYVASCDVVSGDGFEQVIFRASSSLVRSDRVACGPSRLRSQRPEAIQYAYQQGNAEGYANMAQSKEELERYQADMAKYQSDLTGYQSDLQQYERDVAKQQGDVAAYAAAQEEYRRKQAEYQAELERARKAREAYEAAVSGRPKPN